MSKTSKAAITVLRLLGRPGLLVAGGALVLVIALADRLEIGELLDYRANGWIPGRIVLTVVGGALLVAAALITIRTWNQSKRFPWKGSSRETISTTLDDLPPFRELAKGATRVSILARTGGHLLFNYVECLEEIGQAGGKIRLIVVDPASRITASLYGNAETYESKRRSMSDGIRRLKGSIPKDRFKVRMMTHGAPPFSMIHVEGTEGTFIQVALNFVHTRFGQDRPTCLIQETARWYQPFVSEYNNLWKLAKTYRDPNGQSRGADEEPQDVDLPLLVSKKYLMPGHKLRWEHPPKVKHPLAFVTDDGRVRLEDGTVFETPKDAGAEAATRLSGNGWRAWRTQAGRGSLLADVADRYRKDLEEKSRADGI